MKTKNLFIIILSVILMSAFLCSCKGTQTADVSLYDLNKAMSDAASFEKMVYASSTDDDAENLFTYISDMPYSKVKDFCIYYAENGTGNADEIAIICVKNKDDLKTAKDSLSAHLEKRKSLYSTYDKTQLKKLDNAELVSNGNVVALIVSDDHAKISKAFNDFFKG